MWRHSGGDQATRGRGGVAAGAGGKSLLHVGSGRPAPGRLHPLFRDEAWRELRLDIDPQVEPDIIGSITDMGMIESGAHDALFASHTIEHLHSHEVPAALQGFRRVLKADGFALIRTPDLAAIAEALLKHGPDHVAYVAPAGPITPLDMLFGHGRSLRLGRQHMAHHTGFTEERLGRLLLSAGFAEARTLTLPEFDLWAAAFMPEADVDALVREMSRHGLPFEG
jgi:predicted SAM-dependent methyltransferase